jgi:hypothetical protein
MSRVERTETHTDRRDAVQPRQTERGRSSGSGRTADPNPGHTPTRAEGEPGDVEQALRNQKE